MFKKKQIKKSKIAVIGLGTCGKSIALELARLGSDVMAIDSNPKKIEEAADQVSQAIEMNSTDEEAMRAAGVSDVDIAVVAVAEQVEVSVLTVAVLKRLKVQRIIARYMNELHKQILLDMGVDGIFNPEENMGKELARHLLIPDILKHFEITTDLDIFEIQARPEFFNKTIRELDFRAKYGMTIIGIHRYYPETGKKEETAMPFPDYRILPEDNLILVGSMENMNKLLD